MPIFALGCIGLAARSRPLFTIATHLSVAYALFFVMSCQMFVPNVTHASLGPITVPSGFGAIPSGVGLYVMASILGTCLLSFAVTHLLYFFAVGKEIAAVIRVVSSFLRTPICTGFQVIAADRAAATAARQDAHEPPQRCRQIAAASRVRGRECRQFGHRVKRSSRISCSERASL